MVLLAVHVVPVCRSCQLVQGRTAVSGGAVIATWLNVHIGTETVRSGWHARWHHGSASRVFMERHAAVASSFGEATAATTASLSQQQRHGIWTVKLGPASSEL